MDLMMNDVVLRRVASSIDDASIQLGRAADVPALDSCGSLSFPGAFAAHLMELDKAVSALSTSVARIASATRESLDAMVALEEQFEVDFSGVLR